MDANKSSLKMNVGSSSWFSCNGVLSKPQKCSANNSLKIADHFVDGIWSETVVDELLDNLAAQHLALEDAHAELDAEREASAVGIQNALNMISQLEQEKSSLALEHTAYYRETKIRLAFAQEKLSYYEELLEEKNEEIRFLQDQIRTYRTQEENDDRDVDFPSTSLTSNAPQNNLDTYNEADFGDLVGKDSHERCLPNAYCNKSLHTQNFDLDCFEFKDQTSCSEDNSLNENEENRNNHTTIIRRLTVLVGQVTSSIRVCNICI